MENVPSLNHSTLSLRRQSPSPLPNYRQSRVLPHIHEQYDFRINNRFLIEKIINPRRDKTIINSLSQTSCKYFSKKKKELLNMKSSTYRRKIVMRSRENREENRNPGSLSKKGQKDITDDKEKRKGERGRQLKAQQKQNDYNMSRKDDLTASGWIETQQSSLRDNYVGKIIRNGSNSSKITAKRRTNLSNFCEMNQSNQFFLESVAKPEERDLRCGHQNDRIRRMIRKNIRHQVEAL